MDAEINNVIYMELNSGPKIANSTCGKTIDVETIDRDSTVVDSDTYITNMRGTHCCISMAAVVAQTCQNVMLCVCCLSWLQAEALGCKKISQDFLSMFC